MSVDVFIALGSNLANPIQQIKNAIDEIARFEQTNLLKSSSLYRSKPLGGLKQPDYVNAVIKVRTTLTPLSLLDALLATEVAHGRTRDEQNRWCSRTLDCDIILYGTMQLDLPRLTVPHPQMHKRIFVLQPLWQIEPDLCVFGQPIKKLLNTLAEKEALKEIEDEETNP